jgi:predicted methyltransferase
MNSVIKQLSLYGKLTYLAHLFKALTRNHHQEYLPILNEYLTSDSIIIDVGAHACQFTKLLAALAPEGHVYAFEPGGYASSILTKVIRLYRLKNVTHIRQGLGKQYKKENLNIPLKQSGSLGFGLRVT